MKSLEKDRTRRYETASGFARDIQRYLGGEAVEACPPSPSYRRRKVARKHRAGLATMAAFVVLLVAAAAVSTWLAIRATQARNAAQQAYDAEAKERAEAERQAQIARKAQALAQSNEAKAKEQ